MTVFFSLQPPYTHPELHTAPVSTEPGAGTSRVKVKGQGFKKKERKRVLVHFRLCFVSMHPKLKHVTSVEKVNLECLNSFLAKCSSKRLRWFQRQHERNDTKTQRHSHANRIFTLSDKMRLFFATQIIPGNASL